MIAIKQSDSVCVWHRVRKDISLWRDLGKVAVCACPPNASTQPPLGIVSSNWVWIAFSISVVVGRFCGGQHLALVMRVFTSLTRASVLDILMVRDPTPMQTLEQ